MSIEQKVKNNVTFKVGDSIMNESFQDSFHACYFIEQSPFEVLESEINSVRRNAEETRVFTALVAPTQYMKSLYKTVPSSMQEVLGTISWYQDVLDLERLREAERMYASQRVFSTAMNF